MQKEKLDRMDISPQLLLKLSCKEFAATGESKRSLNRECCFQTFPVALA